MIFHRPNPKLIVFSNQLDCMQRVNAFKLLGLVLKPDLSFNDHVSSIVTLCNKRLYVLSLLRKQGFAVDYIASSCPQSYPLCFAKVLQLYYCRYGE
jgi:hypothetical protein